MRDSQAKLDSDRGSLHDGQISHVKGIYLGLYFCNDCKRDSDTEYCGKCGNECEGSDSR